MTPYAEICGAVWATDYGTGNSEFLLGVTNGNLPIGGDSGAPAWRSSGFGSVAQGTLYGYVNGAQNLAIVLKMNLVLFFNGVSLNTVTNP